MARLHNVLRTVRLILASPFVALVWMYRIVSPDHGLLRHLFPYGYCRHEPTCSTYALHQLRQRWLPVALGLIARRILSCNPWTKPSDERLKAIIERQMQK